MRRKAKGLRPKGTTRREFVVSASSAIAISAAGPLIIRKRAHDLVIRNGQVFDGRGTPAVSADVAITGGRIVEVGRVADRGTEEIDARGLAVAPGFIDIHSHGDGSIDEDPRQESVIRQGITTIVVGQDGSSRLGRRGNVGSPVESFASVLPAIEALKPSTNVATGVGLGSVRGAIVGQDDRPATPDAMQKMVAIVEDALTNGACGASSGLEYTPGGFAPLAELIELCKPLAARRLPYSTHMRNEDDRLLDSIKESIDVARGAKCPLQISHLKTQGPRNWSKLDAVFKLVADAQATGMDVAFDRYPYIAYQTGLTNLFPLWSRDGGTQAFLKRLDEPGTQDRVKAECIAKVELIGGWENVHIASVRDPQDKPAEGKRLGSYAKSLGQDPYVLTVTMLKRNAGNIGMVGFAMSEENLDRILAHPWGMVCSDGGAFAIDGPTRRGSPHPRGAGSFPRVIAKYVRERKALTLTNAIKKMTSLPASRVRLADRGQIAKGMAGDIVVFDPVNIKDEATYEQPFAYPTGITAVVVNGSISFRDGQRAEKNAGRALRPAL
jgi:N-acyl-D-amino-acid deacylase